MRFSCKFGMSSYEDLMGKWVQFCNSFQLFMCKSTCEDFNSDQAIVCDLALLWCNDESLGLSCVLTNGQLPLFVKPKILSTCLHIWLLLSMWLVLSCPKTMSTWIRLILLCYIIHFYDEATYLKPMVILWRDFFWGQYTSTFNDGLTHLLNTTFGVRILRIKP